MIIVMMLLGVLLQDADGARVAPGIAAADQITLRDGSVVKGLVVAATTGPRGSVEFVVRRAWAEEHMKRHAKVAAGRRAPGAAATAQRRKRLEAWRRERAASAGPDDRIIAWIDGELARLNAASEPESSILLKVRLPRSDVRGLDRRPARMRGCCA